MNACVLGMDDTMRCVDSGTFWSAAGHWLTSGSLLRGHDPDRMTWAASAEHDDGVGAAVAVGGTAATGDAAGGTEDMSG